EPGPGELGPLLRLGTGDAVADPELRQQDARVRWIALDLAPQLAHEHPQIVRVLRMIGSPDLVGMAAFLPRNRLEESERRFHLIKERPQRRPKRKTAGLLAPPSVDVSVLRINGTGAARSGPTGSRATAPSRTASGGSATPAAGRRPCWNRRASGR